MTPSNGTECPPGEAAIAVTLRELLAFDVFRLTEPEVVAGAEALDRELRWVHSSEIYEIAPLLSGGELLLTTGLGLAGVDAGARRHYLRELAHRGVAGLALELGRSFVEVPEELVGEAQRHGFPLLALRRVVPFVRLTEVANTAIIDYSSRRLRLGEVVARALNEALITGAGVGRLLTVAASVTRCPLVLIAAGGALVGQHGVEDDRGAWAIADRPAAEAPVTVHDQPWGRLVAGPGSPLPVADLDLALERVATAIALAVLQGGSPPSRRDRQVSALLADLLAGDGLRADELQQRGTVVGFHPPAGRWTLGVVVADAERAAGRAIVDDIGRMLGHPALAGRVGTLTLGVLAVAPDSADPLGTAARAAHEVLRRSGVPGARVALGLPVAPGAGLQAVGQSLREARTASALGPQQLGLRTPAPVVDARSYLLEVVLSQRPPEQLHDLAERVLRPVLDWDASHGSELTQTLETYLRHGSSVTRAAVELAIGRQALYQRIDRIETLLGHPVSDPGQVTALLVAACARRLAGATSRR